MSQRVLRTRMIASIAGFTCAAVAVPARAQWIVYDPTNYSQNVLTAARELQQVNNSILSLENQATMLTNEARNLASQPYSSLANLEQSITQTQQLLLFGTAAPTQFPRQDLEAVFLTGISGVNQPAHPPVPSQSNHDFTSALADLDGVLRAQPGNRQAWLTRASIRQAQADYAGALADCGQLAINTLGLVPDVCTAASMALTGHAPMALRAVNVSLGVNAAEAGRSPGVALWALTLEAETAARLDDPSAESWFARALALDRHDPYLLAAWSDWLLDHERPREVVALLADDTRIDPLLLRLALAEQAVRDPAAPEHIVDLANRFEASRLRGETVHRREEARFQLALMHNPAQALALARANWQVQREPADARILLETAAAASQPEAAAPALDWLHRNGVQDVRLVSLATRLSASGKS